MPTGTWRHGTSPGDSDQRDLGRRARPPTPAPRTARHRAAARGTARSRRARPTSARRSATSLDDRAWARIGTRAGTRTTDRRCDDRRQREVPEEVGVRAATGATRRCRFVRFETDEHAARERREQHRLEREHDRIDVDEQRGADVERREQHDRGVEVQQRDDERGEDPAARRRRGGSAPRARASSSNTPTWSSDAASGTATSTNASGAASGRSTSCRLARVDDAGRDRDAAPRRAAPHHAGMFHGRAQARRRARRRGGRPRARSRDRAGSRRPIRLGRSRVPRRSR